MTNGALTPIPNETYGEEVWRCGDLFATYAYRLGLTFLYIQLPGGLYQLATRQGTKGGVAEWAKKKITERQRANEAYREKLEDQLAEVKNTRMIWDEAEQRVRAATRNQPLNHDH